MFESWQTLYFVPELATLMREPGFDAEMARIRAHMAEQLALAREFEREDPAARWRRRRPAEGFAIRMLPGPA
jgi:hypothetical protein